ncbi:hypothetical protein Dsin_009099 [Dipteronia sinensis]|uniref:Reverse transcriptase domain-containing protein n=1 Tax=Dipteronia sinensis TaxID=43782 RepID=A0AAE0AR65_9ROSI|nr:hypothetical protein Dsin_009099 [Dipteronia sinensis]
MVEDVIPSLVTDVENAFLISIPSMDDIHDVVFAINAASAPGPDGFSGGFYQCCWEVFGFIEDRHIEDCITIASDCVNVMHKKCSGGNLAMKIDIRKAFDTLDWSFLRRVLQAFGFSPVFMDWIDSILGSSRLSMLINGSPEEDFLSRLLSRMVDSSQLLPISSSRGFSAPTHLLYADDVLIFCRGTVKNLKNIMSTFEVYGNISGQLVNWGKSSIYFGSSVSPSRNGRLQSLVGMQIGQLPFFYLGVPLF